MHCVHEHPTLIYINTHTHTPTHKNIHTPTQKHTHTQNLQKYFLSDV